MNAWQFRSVRFQRKKTSSFDYYKVLYTGTEMLIELLFRLFSPLLLEETGSLYRKRFSLVERQVHVLKYVIKKSTEFNKIRRNLSEQLLDADEIHCEECEVAGQNVFLGPTIHLPRPECLAESHRSHLEHVVCCCFQMRFQ